MKIKDLILVRNYIDERAKNLKVDKDVAHKFNLLLKKIDGELDNQLLELNEKFQDILNGKEISNI